MLWALLAMRKRRIGAYLAGVAGFLRLLPRALRQRVRWTPNERHALLARLRESEREIFADVSAPDRSRRDTFWRLYFGLFPLRGSSAAKAPEERKIAAHPAGRDVQPGVESPAPEGRQTPAPRSTHF